LQLLGKKRLRQTCGAAACPSAAVAPAVVEPVVVVTDCFLNLLPMTLNHQVRRVRKWPRRPVKRA